MTAWESPRRVHESALRNRRGKVEEMTPRTNHDHQLATVAELRDKKQLRLVVSAGATIWVVAVDGRDKTLLKGKFPSPREVTVTFDDRRRPIQVEGVAVVVTAL